MNSFFDKILKNKDIRLTIYLSSVWTPFSAVRLRATVSPNTDHIPSNNYVDWRMSMGEASERWEDFFERQGSGFQVPELRVAGLPVIRPRALCPRLRFGHIIALLGLAVPASAGAVVYFTGG